MRTVCQNNRCAGCMACIDICPKHAIKIEDELKSYNAVIDPLKCVNCKLCDSICPQKEPPDFLAPKAWFQGWCNDNEKRKSSSSGGFAYAISKSFIENGGIVCSCVFKNGRFGFSIINNEEELTSFSGSKYVKSNPSGIYRDIIRELKEGKKVLFIGLPCQVAALKKYTKEAFENSLYTVDLICHGTPSPRLLDKFLSQYNKSLSNATSIIFRVKAKMQIHLDDCGLIEKGVSDKYTIAFLNGLTYTDNCYECNYARTERISDITLGDSWGTDLGPDEARRGVSLALCQTDKGEKLLRESNVTLLDVNLENAIRNNHQLSKPSEMPSMRGDFFKRLQKKQFNNLVFRIYPKQCMKQDVKELLLKLKLLKI